MEWECFWLPCCLLHRRWVEQWEGRPGLWFTFQLPPLAMRPQPNDTVKTKTRDAVPNALGWAGRLSHQALRFQPGCNSSDGVKGIADSIAPVRLLQGAFLNSARAGEATLRCLGRACKALGKHTPGKGDRMSKGLEARPCSGLGLLFPRL